MTNLASTHRLLLLSFLLLGMSCIVFAQDSGGSHSVLASRTHSEELEWAKIHAIKDEYIKAAESGSVDNLAPFLTSEFSATVLTGEEIQGFDELKAYNAEMQELIGPGSTHTMTVKYEPGLMHGDIAVVHGTTDEVVVTSLKNRFTFRSLWTGIMLREHGEWKLHRLHVSMDPVQNEFVKHYCAKAIKRSVGITVMASIFISCLLGYWWNKRRQG